MRYKKSKSASAAQRAGRHHAPDELQRLLAIDRYEGRARTRRRRASIKLKQYG
jgi:hypothetical protein